MILRKIVWLLSSALSVGLVSSGLAWQQLTPEEQINGVDYSKAKWKAKSDPELVKIRKEVERQFSKSDVDVKKIWAKVNEAAHGPHKNRYLAFKWALTAYYCQVKGYEVRMTEIGDALENAPYDEPEYARARFLTEPRIEPMRSVLALGKRLLRRDPDDDEVGFKCIFYAQYHTFKKNENFSFAENLGKRLAARHANEARTYRMLGGLYCQAYAARREKRFAELSLKYYDKYFEMDPNNRKIMQGRLKPTLDILKEAVRK